MSNKCLTLSKCCILLLLLTAAATTLLLTSPVLSAPLTESATTAVTVNVKLRLTTVLHIWLRARTNTEKAVLWSCQDSNISNCFSEVNIVVRTNATEWFEFKEVQLHKAGNFTFMWDNTTTEMSYFYAFEPENVKQKGIEPLFVREKNKHHPALAKHSFHLRTPLGWNNEPNGLARTNDGLYHVFYQHIPHQTRFYIWQKEFIANMHWGHAVSTDLVNWVHMPVFLIPRYQHDKGEEGVYWTRPGVKAVQWYSGSSVPTGPSGVRVFVSSPITLGPKDKFMSRQVEVLSSDGISLDKCEANENLKPIVSMPTNPEYNGKALMLNFINFRDPMVFQGPQNYWYMTVGSEDSSKTDPQGGVIVLYRTNDNGAGALDSGWKYQSVLLTDNRDGFGNIECAGIIPLGDHTDPDTKYALMYGREWGRTPNLIRARDTLIRLGTFDGSVFKTISEQTLDFAFGSYGHQGFYERQSGQILMMGWLSWWNEWDGDSPFFSSQNLPRIMKVAPDGKALLIGPHPNVYAKLVGERMAQVEHKITNETMSLLPSGTAYVRLELNQKLNSDNVKSVVVSIAHDKYKELGVEVGPEGLKLIKKMKKVEGAVDKRPLLAAGAQPDIVHIFIDIDSMEIFGELLRDGGTPRWTGTTRLTGNGTVAAKSVSIADNGLLERAEVFAMKPAKQLGYFWDKN